MMNYTEEKLQQVKIKVNKEWSLDLEEFLLKSGAYGTHELLYQEAVTDNLNNENTILYFFFADDFPLSAFLPMVEVTLAVKFDYSIQSIEYHDYIKEFEKSFSAFSLSSNTLLVPPWELEKYNADLHSSQKHIILRPGLAFGTGKHITSQLMTQYIETNIDQGDKVFDLGTGSGILALVCATYGASIILAADIDKLAIQSAKENLALNKQLVSSKVDFFVGSFDYFEVNDTAYDCNVFIANILTAIFKKNAKHLKFYLDRSSKWALSGIPNHEKKIFTTFLIDEIKINPNEFSVIEQDEWCIFANNSKV